MRLAPYMIVLSMAVCWFPSCSIAQGDKLDRATALSVLRKAGGLDKEITAEANTIAEWSEANAQFYGTPLTTFRLYAQGDLDFHNRLVDAGVLRKKPDQFQDCKPEPDCKDRNKIYNFAVIPSADVRVGYAGQSMNGRSIEFGTLVLARASDPKVTGITQEGIEASVDVEFGYSPTDLYKRVFPLIRDALAVCSRPELAKNPPQYCGHWPSEAEIGAKKETGTVEFKKYDDGWRIVKGENR